MVDTGGDPRWMVEAAPRVRTPNKGILISGVVLLGRDTVHKADTRTMGFCRQRGA